MTVRLFSRSLGLASLLLIGSTATSRSAYLATDLGTNNAYNTSSGYNLTGPGSGSQGTGLAVEFTINSASPVAFGSAQLALQFRGGADALTVLLMTDAGGVPGTTLETISLTNIPSGPSLVTATSTTNTLLNPGTNYWLAASATGNTAMSWMQNSQGQMNHLAVRYDSGSGPGPWNSASGNPDVAYSISAVTSVPGPDSGFLLGTGLVALVGLGRFRRANRTR